MLLVSRAGDREVDQVGRLLGAAGTPVTRLNAETAGSAGVIVDLERRAVFIDGQWIRPTVTWRRHFSQRAMAAERRTLRRAFAADSWQALTDQLNVVSMAVIASGDPGLLAQLAAAQACGVATPRTVVTTDPAQAVAVLDCPRVIIKALHSHFVEASPGRLTGVFPEVAPRGLVARIPVGPPIVLQEYVDHDQEIRVYYADGQVAASFAVTKPGPGAEWLDSGRVSAERIEVPSALADAVAAIADALSIKYGAFDFLDADGVPVFLEVNIAGDWCWLETKIGAAPVTMAVATMLASIHRRSLAAEPKLDANPVTSVNPVTFLSYGIKRTPVDKEQPSL